ncbi:hypothetical protein ACP3TY_06125 [Pseudomonas rustica]|uniref:hypothetical protein n=1 Tax=Pseudomonas TaxID=286 RepID=UPI0012FE214A|nr:hypothetical protein [Pseudomonas sp. Z003-0.4C(8344-21)]
MNILELKALNDLLEKEYGWPGEVGVSPDDFQRSHPSRHQRQRDPQVAIYLPRSIIRYPAGLRSVFSMRRITASPVFTDTLTSLINTSEQPWPVNADSRCTPMVSPKWANSPNENRQRGSHLSKNELCICHLRIRHPPPQDGHQIVR